MESLPPVASMGYWASRSVHGILDNLDAPSKKSPKANNKEPKSPNNASKKVVNTKESKKPTTPTAVARKKEESKLLDSWDEVLKAKKTAVKVKASADVGNEVRWDVILSAMKEIGPGNPAKTVDEEQDDHEGFSTSAGDDSEEFSDCSSEAAWEDAHEDQQIYSLSLLLSHRPTKTVLPPGFAPKGLHTRTVVAIEEGKNAAEHQSAANALISVIKVKSSQSPKVSSLDAKKTPTSPKKVPKSPKKASTTTQSLPAKILKADMKVPVEPLPPSTKAVRKEVIASAPWRTPKPNVTTPPPGLAPPPGLSL